VPLKVLATPGLTPVILAHHRPQEFPLAVCLARISIGDMNPTIISQPTGVSLIGAPTDIGASTQGASMGPQALRVAGLVQTLAQFGLDVKDCGNLSGPDNPWQAAVGGYRHLPEVVQWNQLLHDAVYAELQQARLPIMLGGDHCLAIGSVSAVARHCRVQGKKLRVLWLDAHADFNTALLTPSGNLHGMPVACLCGLGPSALIGMSGQVPALKASELRQIGIRSVDEGEKRLVHDPMRLPNPYRPEARSFLSVWALLSKRWTGPPAPPKPHPWVQAVRQNPPPFWAMESLLKEYPISSAEGLALMRLAEALLRVPDAETAIALTADQLGRADFDAAGDKTLARLSSTAIAMSKKFLPDSEAPTAASSPSWAPAPWWPPRCAPCSCWAASLCWARPSAKPWRGGRAKRKIAKPALQL
jgi:hypothetical protein